MKQSSVISAMRFPLIVLVVFSHSLGFERVEITGSIDGWNVYHFISEMISHNFAKIAVCWFFVFSGYFFFRNLNGEFRMKDCLEKWKKRVRSLLLPYILWNLLLIAAIVIKSGVFSLAGFGPDEQMEWVKEGNVLAWLWSGPANFPLWYMRDLILLSLLAPLWYYLFKKTKWVGLGILIALYASGWNPAIPGMRGIFFFGLGAFLGIWQKDIVELSRKVKVPAYIGAVVTLLAATVFNASAYHEYFLRLFYPFGMVAFMNICDSLASKESRQQRLERLSGSVFFIYGAHEIFILGWTKGLFLRIFGDGLAGSVISYFGVPIVVVIVCLTLYQLFKKFTPKTLAFVCGGRITKK